MDEFIVKCVKMADIFAKLNDTMQVRKILTADEYALFLEMYRIFSAFQNTKSTNSKGEKKKCMKL